MASPDAQPPRKRRRRNAIRPNSVETEAIRQVAEDFRNSEAINAVNNMSLACDNPHLPDEDSHVRSGDENLPTSDDASRVVHVDDDLEDEDEISPGEVIEKQDLCIPPPPCFVDLSEWLPASDSSTDDDTPHTISSEPQSSITQSQL